MGRQLRELDNAEGLGDYFKQAGARPLGHVIQGDGSKTDLHFRDMTNKLMHGSAFEWADSEQPKIIVQSDDPNRWRLAEIDVQALMALVGGLGF